MTDLISSFTQIFSFLITQLTNIANFFTTSTLGILLLCIVLLYVLIDVIIKLINR